MPRPIPTFAGRLVTLRPIDPAADAAAVFEWNKDPDLHRWTGTAVPATADETRAELERLAAAPDSATWTVVDNPSAKPAGVFTLFMENRSGLLVVGEDVRFGKPFWRKGHHRQARYYLFRHAFETLGAVVYETATWGGNTNAVRANEAYGFTLGGVELSYHPKLETSMALRRYRMTREQWRGIYG